MVSTADRNGYQHQPPTSANNEQTLCLVWKHPVTRQRYLIGYLWRDQAGYHFHYDFASPRSLNAALEAGFRLLDSFPTPEGEWHSPTLFPTFARRLCPRWRATEVRKLGLPYDDPMEFLRLTGGRVPTDTLEFLEPIKQGEKPRSYTVRFPVAGWRYYAGESVIGEFRPGVRVRLERQPDNEWDPNAIRVLSPSGVHVGYVPAIYAWYLEEDVASGNYEATVDQVGEKDDPQQRVVVRVSGGSSSLSDVRCVPQGIEDYAASLRG